MFVYQNASQRNGLTLVSALAPTLGIELPYWARLGGVLIGRDAAAARAEVGAGVHTDRWR
jgi:hypothetical protein